MCQQAFKIKYGEHGYQEMVASPGDFGIEGFTKKTGLAFQCYCPNKQYTQDELYEKQRDKITVDLNKLKKYAEQIMERLGQVKINEWIFVTPEVNQNKILSHVQSKQGEVLSWKLPFLSDDFVILVKDGDFYSSEFYKIQTIRGEKILLSSNEEGLSFHGEENDLTEYESNINRKNSIRVSGDQSQSKNKLEKLNEITFNKWFEGERFVKKIEKDAPQIFYHLARIINQYEEEVSELSLSWNEGADKLVDRVRDGLFERIKEELPSISATDQRKISDHMVAKWIALCPLDFE